MAGNALNYRPAQNNAVTPSTPQVERCPDGRVVVRAAYPPGKVREAMTVAIGGCVALALFPLPFVWFSGRSFPGLQPVLFLPWMLFVAFAAWIVVRRALRAGESYTIEADPDGITIHRFRGRREGCERLPRERITDVRIGFGQAGKSGRSTSWLIIAVTPWYRTNPTLLHDLGADRLARIADAVREGLGLEPVDWPSGRPRKTSAAAGPAGSKRPAPPDDREWVKALLFGAAFLTMGSTLAVSGGRDAWRTYDRMRGLHQATCELLDKRVTDGIGDHQWGRHASGYYQAWARVRYQDGGGVSRTVAGDLFPTNATETGRPPREVLRGMTVGNSFPLWVDDRDPTRVYLSRGDESPWSYSVMIGGGTIFALSGLVCLVEGIVTRPRRATRPPA